jgi:hypothetical protein
MDCQQLTPTPTSSRDSSLPLSARRLPMSTSQQSRVSASTPKTPQRRKSRSPQAAALDLDHRVSPIGSDHCFVAYLLKVSPVVKARLVEQQDLATRQAMDEKDIVINKLQGQVCKLIHHIKWQIY